MEKRQKKRKKKNSFRIGVLILVLVLAIIIVTTLIILYNGLERFESTTPRAAIDSYFSQLAAGEYEQIKTDSGFEPDEINSWDDYTAFLLTTFGKDYKGYTYRQVAGGNKDDGQLYAVYNGDERIGELVLSASSSAAHGYVVRASIDYLEPFEVVAPGDVTIKVNGEELAKEGEGVTVTPNDLFEELSGDQIPTIIKYKLEKMLAKPELEAAGPDGTACEINVDEKTRTATAAKQLSSELEQQYSQRMQDTIKAYAMFISEDSTLANFTQYLYPNTNFAADIKTFDAVWYADHDSYSFEDMKTSGVTQTSESTFTGEIEYVFQVQFQGEIKSFPSRYKMGFVLQNNQWLLVKFETLNYEKSGTDTSAGGKTNSAG